MNRKFCIICFSLLFAITLSFAQSVIIQGTIENLNNEKVYLQTFYGKNAFIIDSAITNAKGRFVFENLKINKPAVIRIIFSEKRFLDFIYSGEVINFHTDLSNLIKNIKISTSIENTIYYDYIKFITIANGMLTEIYKLSLSVNKSNKLFDDLRLEYESVEKQKDYFISQIIKYDTMLNVAVVINAEQLPEVNLQWDYGKQLNHKIDYFFKFVPNSNDILLNSNILSYKIIFYLNLIAEKIKYYKIDNIEEEFINASEAIMLKFVKNNQNKEIANFVKDYLIDGFKSLKYKKVVEFIDK